MTTKAFSILLLASLVMGVALGGAFAGGVALGKNGGPDQGQGSSSLRPPSGFQGEVGGTGSGGREGGFRDRSSGGAAGRPAGSDSEGSGGGDSTNESRQSRHAGEGPAGSADRHPVSGTGQEYFGTIASFQDDVVILDSPHGQVQATISESTGIQKTLTGSVDDLAVGAGVSVLGRPAEGGLVQARSLTLLSEGSEVVSGSPGGSGRRGLGGRVSLSGTIEGIEDGLVTIATTDGKARVTLGEDTTIQRLEAGSRTDLVKGVVVRISGSPDQEGQVLATVVILVPERLDRFERRGPRQGDRQPP